MLKKIFSNQTDDLYCHMVFLVHMNHKKALYYIVFFYFRYILYILRICILHCLDRMICTQILSKIRMLTGMLHVSFLLQEDEALFRLHTRIPYLIDVRNGAFVLSLDF